MKRPNCHHYPIFFLIRHAVHKTDGSGWLGFLDHGAYKKKEPLYKAMLELAARYVRRYKPIAAHLGSIEDRIAARFNYIGGSYKFQKAMPNRHSAIGTLTVIDGEIVATAIDTDVAFSAARYRDAELQKLRKKRIQPTGPVLDAWILQKETQEVIRFMAIQNRENDRLERIRNAYKNRSETAKQTWIRRQQSSCSDEQRRGCATSCADHG